MDYIDAKPEHIIGKTIAEATITDSNIEIKFTDGSEVNFDLHYYGRDGARIDNNYWAATDSTE